MNFFSLGVTAEALRANIGPKSAISLWSGLVDPKFQVDGAAPTNDSSSQKTRLNVLSYGIKIWTDLSSVLSQSMRLTDWRTAFSSLNRVCIPCSAVKTFKIVLYRLRQFGFNSGNQLFALNRIIYASLTCVVRRSASESQTTLSIW